MCVACGESPAKEFGSLMYKLTVEDSDKTLSAPASTMYLFTARFSFAERVVPCRRITLSRQRTTLVGKVYVLTGSSAVIMPKRKCTFNEDLQKNSNI